jgi:hypothetical protein
MACSCLLFTLPSQLDLVNRFDLHMEVTGCWLNTDSGNLHGLDPMVTGCQLNRDDEALWVLGMLTRGCRLVAEKKSLFFVPHRHFVNISLTAVDRRIRTRVCCRKGACPPAPQRSGEVQKIPVRAW